MEASITPVGGAQVQAEAVVAAESTPTEKAAQEATSEAVVGRAVADVPARPAKTTALVGQPVRGEPPGAAGAVGGTLFALALVIGLILGLAWLARRMPGVTGMRGNGGLRVVTSLALGTRERLVVVEVGGTQLLLGTGAAGTRLLHTLETPLPTETPAQPVPFAQLLAKQFGRKA